MLPQCPDNTHDSFVGYSGRVEPCGDIECSVLRNIYYLASIRLERLFKTGGVVSIVAQA